MMKRTIAVVLLGFCGMSLACADKRDKAEQSTPPGPKLTREYLVAHGFKPSPTDRGLYERKHVRLGDALRDLGIPYAALETMINVDSDHMRGADVQGMSVLVQSEVRQGKAGLVMDSLDDLNAICTVTVPFGEEGPAPKHVVRKVLETDSSPRMRIKSVTLPKDRSKPLQITFELAAEGKMPLVVSQRHFGMTFVTEGRSLQRMPGVGVSFPKATPERITVLPGKPVMFTVTASDAMWNPVTRKPWSDLPSGQYVLCVTIGSGKDQSPAFDYEWVGDKYSDEYRLVIK